jgi:hypothetical protein
MSVTNKQMWQGKLLIICVSLFLVIAAVGCSQELAAETLPPDRESQIPEDQIKIFREIDIYPVVSETDEYLDPEPLPYPVNTRGAEDSAFIMPDGQTLYVWFTPDVKNPVEKQVTDGVTGIYVFHKQEEGWGSPERVVLQDPGKASLEGCEFVLGDTMWFCAAREGYTGLNWFTAQYKDGHWTDWELAGFKPEHEVGELHISADGSELYFHSSRSGGKGGYDIWISEWINGEWGEPENIDIVNSPYTDGWPFVTQDGSELWFTRGNGAPTLFRSKKINGDWGEPVQMFSHFSGEASLDIEGNVYFTHHFYQDDQMLEADIYIARKK